MSFRRPFRLPTFLAICIAVLGLSAPASAGTISLAWNPVSHTDLAGYRVYYNPTAGNYSQSTDVGLTPEVTLSGLANCTTHYVAVKARGSDGSVSPQFSAEISGWARPEVLSVSPSSVERDSHVNLTIAGSNFRSGATIQLSNPGVTVNSVVVNGCSQLVANVSIGTSAALGGVDVEVINPDQVFGAGAALFSVTADSAPPSIISVQAVNVDSTAATISWSTDEPADSQVFYRRAGESVYQQTSLDATLVTQHQIDLTGLSPDSTYEYHVRSADTAGNVSTSSPDQTFVTSSIGYSYLRIEAESGALAWPVISTQGSDAFRGAWIDTPRRTPQGNSSNPAGTASIGFYLPNPGSWHFWYRIYGPGTNNNSWYEGLDGGGMSYFTTTQSRVWQWISGRSYSLDAGLHTLTVGGRESEARLDRVLITDDPGFVPSEQPGADVTPPAQVSALGAAPSDGANSLSWNNPGSADLDRVVVRYRTDGSHPQSPVDGLPVFDQPAPRSIAQSLTHSDLSNDTTYYYSVFALDSEGNVSNPSTIQSAPDANTPSVGQVQETQRSDGSTPALPCVRHDCSNDVDWSGTDNGISVVLGDERLVWQPFVAWDEKTCGNDPQQPCTTSSDERCYEIASHPDLTTIKRVCEATSWSPTAGKWGYIPPLTWFVPYATGPEHFPQIGLPYRYVIRACAGTLCSDWAPKTGEGGQDYAEFVGVEYACFGSENRNRCEKSCYSGAPKMFPEIPDCSDPY